MPRYASSLSGAWVLAAWLALTACGAGEDGTESLFVSHARPPAWYKPAARLYVNGSGKARRECLAGILLGAYDRHGHQNPRWNDAATALLQGVADAAGGALAFAALEEKARAVLALDCKDPVVRSLALGVVLKAGRAGDRPSFPEWRKRRNEDMAAVLADGYDPATRAYFAHLLDLETAWDKGKPHRDAMFAALLEAVRAGAFDGDRAWALADFFVENGARHRNALLPLVDELDKEKLLDEWTRLVLRGLHHYHVGWQIRGGARANLLTEGQGRGFHDEIKLAEENFRKAHDLHPDRPQAAAYLARVCMSMGDETGHERRFRETVAAEFDYAPAYFNRLEMLLPRWRGSHEAMLRFGDECLRTRRFDTGVPYLFAAAVFSIVSDIKGHTTISYPDGIRELLSRKDIALRLERLWKGLEEAPAWKPYRAFRQMAQMRIAMCGQQWDRAKALLGEDDDDALGPPPLWSNYYTRAERRWYEAEVGRCAGRFGELWRNAFAAHGRGEIDDALSWYRKIGEAARGVDDGEALTAWRHRLAVPYQLKEIEMYFTGGTLPHRSAWWYALEHDPDAALGAVKAGLPLAELRVQAPVLWTELLALGDDAAAPFVGAWVARGINTKARDKDNRTLLTLAIKEGANACVQAALDGGADPNVNDGRRNSPLSACAWNKNADAVPILVRAGADPDRTDIQGETPLIVCAKNEAPAVAAALLAAGAKPEVRDRMGATPLMQAVWKKTHATVQALLDGGADPNALGYEQQTVLWAAVWNDNRDAARRLLAAGADRDAAVDGTTVLQLARQKGFREMAELLEGPTPQPPPKPAAPVYDDLEEEVF